ncbi:MAG: hypothetical protein Q8916_08435 [Bacteroidota bacterium]|nr:hypothetical protein [Bacteroidota bacterium]
MKQPQILFISFSILILSSCQNRDREIKPADSMMTPAPVNSPVQSTYAISYKDIKIGASREEFKNLLDNTFYADIIKVTAKPFGKLNSDIHFYDASPIKWFGIDGDLEVEFSETTGKMINVIWSVANTSESDFDILVKQIGKELPNGIDQRSIENDHGSNFLSHSWKTKKTSYDLRSYSSGLLELKIPAENNQS